MPQDQDKVLEFYIKRIDSVRKEFPRLTSPEFDSAVQDAVDVWTDDAEEYLRENGTGDVFQLPMKGDTDSIREALRYLKDRYAVDTAGIESRISEEGDNSDIIEEITDLIREYDGLVHSELISYLQRSSNETLETLRSWFRKMSSLDPITRRCLWGLTPSDFRKGMVADFERYSKVFRYDKEVRRFTDCLGRKGEFADSVGTVISPYGDTRIGGSGSEIAGVELGRDISSLVPSEISSMMDDDLGILFDLKYVEGRLMCFSREDSVETEEDTDGDSDAPRNMGPMILICDTSGSMRGTPLFLSKALCFTMITRASQQGRRVLRIDFNARSRHVDITPDDHIHQLHEFLTTNASGGTDPWPALKEAIELIDEERYTLADIVVISDFGLDMSNFRRSNRSMITLREHGCRIHSVFVPSKRAKNLEDFDSSWGIDGYRRKHHASKFRRLD